MVAGLAAAGVSAAGNVMSGLLNQAFAKRNAKIQTQQQKKLMDYQNQYTEWQQLNGQSLDKQGLKNAGLSTATMQGPMPLAGSAAGQAGMPSSPSFGSLGGDAVAAYYNAKQIDAGVRNTNADSYLKEQEGKYYEEFLQSRNKEAAGRANSADAQGQVDQQTITTKVEQFKQDLFLAKQQGKINAKTMLKLDAEVDNIKEQANKIRLENKWIDKKSQAEISHLTSQARKAFLEGDYQKVVNRMADLGVFVNGSFIGSIAALLTSGHGQELGKVVNDTVVGAGKGLIEGIFGDILSAGKTTIEGFDFLKKLILSIFGIN